MYAYLKRRMNLSLQNRNIYEDENGLFIFYKQAEIAEELHISERRVRAIFQGMTNHALIETRKQGMGLPQKIYLKNVIDISGTNCTGQSGTNCTGQSGTNCTGPYSKRIERRDKRIENREKRSREGDLLQTFAGENESLLEALMAWAEMRKQIKSPLTDYATKLALNKLQKLSGGDEVTMVEIVNQTIENGWKSFFPLKNYRVKPKRQSIYEALEGMDERINESASNIR